MIHNAITYVNKSNLIVKGYFFSVCMCKSISLFVEKADLHEYRDQTIKGRLHFSHNLLVLVWVDSVWSWRSCGNDREQRTLGTEWDTAASADTSAHRQPSNIQPQLLLRVTLARVRGSCSALCRSLFTHTHKHTHTPMKHCSGS